MMKTFLLLSIVGIGISCAKSREDFVSQSKDKTIDSLKRELEDCKGQAQIMADILEQERIELEKKKAIQ